MPDTTNIFGRTPPDLWTQVTLSGGPDSPPSVAGAGTVTRALGGDDVLPLPSAFDAWVLAGDGDDAITGFAQSSVLEGGAGRDTIEGGLLSDLYGGADDDLLIWRAEALIHTPFVFEFGPYVELRCIAGEAGDDAIRIFEFDQLAYDVRPATIDTGIDGGAGDDRLETTLNSTAIRVRTLEDGFEIDGVSVVNVETFDFADATLAVADMAALAASQATTGSEGDDLLTGTAAAERFDGLGGNDWIVPGGGLDTVIGGPGTDMMSFADRTDGRVDVQLAAVDYEGYYARLYPERTTTPDGTLDVSGIEGVTGTIFNDRLTGSDGDNTLRGLWGDDVLEGLGGARDVLDGGGGIDTASYRLAATGTSDPGVTVSLLAGRGWYGDAAGDVLIDIENLRGTASYDTLTGDHGANYLYGGFGTEGDILIGNGGDDTIEGGYFNNPSFRVNGQNDVAVFNYDRDMYEISTTSRGSNIHSYEMTVRYTGPGPGDGTDTLINIRTLRFADQTLNLLDQQGSDGDDEFYGMFARTRFSDGHNILFQGGDGDDTYHAGEGIDTIDGGAGSDWVDFSGRLDPVVFNLEDGYALSGYRFDLISIENAIGSEQNDRFSGSSAANHLKGLGGDDFFVGSWGGRDVYDGGAGTDTLNYAADRGGVNVSLLAGKGWTGQASDDVLIFIENLIGSVADDILTGDHGDNRIEGQTGSDTLIGNAGDDILIGSGPTSDGGQDVAIFSYDRALYDIDTDAGGTTTVAYTGPNAGDGTDTLMEIEVLRFADGDFIL